MSAFFWLFVCACWGRRAGTRSCQLHASSGPRPFVVCLTAGPRCSPRLHLDLLNRCPPGVQWKSQVSAGSAVTGGDGWRQAMGSATTAGRTEVKAVSAEARAQTAMSSAASAADRQISKAPQNWVDEGESGLKSGGSRSSIG